MTHIALIGSADERAAIAATVRARSFCQTTSYEAVPAHVENERPDLILLITENQEQSLGQLALATTLNIPIAIWCKGPLDYQVFEEVGIRALISTLSGKLYPTTSHKIHEELERVLRHLSRPSSP